MSGVRALLLACAALATTGANAQDAPALEQELSALLASLPGEYVGAAPKGMTPQGETHQLMHRFRAVTAPQLGERLMYYTVTPDTPANDTAQRPILQAKVFVFESAPTRSANTMHALVLTQAQAEALRDEGDAGWQKLEREGLMSFPSDCFFTWTRDEAGFNAAGSTTCSYESRAFKQVITPRMRYRISEESFQFEETLLGEDGTAIVSTGGLQSAARQ